ncbi:type I methionyl aminopeptidase [Wenzhouxiangella sp. XN79A]|uniref:type I methionyl aminopeptidase n=1 Tax=Wenzhouxiangella sp. XN79A TaxID=2724193 RepID=UPI00144AA0E1|nr:type I methionyl aminopeptidase [Wenzhouxiangella sp. XN79A]NKI35325.1 type I methionyl aminopeptidase [Wenzhouxiangella sp. XN79A]
MHSRPKPDGIQLKTPDEIEAMRVAGQQAASVLAMLREHVRPGITTGELDAIAHAYIVDELNGIPAPLNYRGFPKSICTSVNHVVCHGIPGDRVLKDGDIVNIDVTVIQDGWHGDTSKMFYVGEPSIKARRICEVAHQAMVIGIEAVRPGVTLGDIGHLIQRYVEGQRCSVVREYCGHGIGRVFHEPPQVLHYGRPGDGVVLEPGMTFTIEPMVNLGKPGTRLLADGWTVLTRDRSLSAQWEHTMAVIDDGVDVLTRLPDDPL